MMIESNKNILIFLLTAIALIALPHINNVPAPIFGFFSLLLSWRFLTIWQAHWAPNRTLVFLITLSAIVLLVSQHQTIVGREAGSSVALTALGLKLMEIRQNRDLYVISFFSFVVAASLLLFEQSILMALYIFVVCTVLLSALISINNLQPQTWSAIKTSALIIVQALPLAAVVFVLFPRMNAPRWMIFDEPNRATTGLGESMEPGSISQLGFSDELVFRVKFTGPPPPMGQRYWRGPVLSYTDGKRWSPIKNRFFQRFQDDIRFAGQSYQYKLMMEPQRNNWVFALDMPRNFDPAMLMRNGNYQLFSRVAATKRAEYQIISHLQYNTGYITRTEYQDNLQLPKPASDRLQALVRQLHGFDQPPETFINNVLTHFRTEKFFYTLTPPLMPANPIETFLFETRAGFCGHYAAAFVYLMRIANIPARVVTGYQGGELNKIGGFLEVRQANAHAWAEVWINNKGWLRVDPTAAIAPERVQQNVDIDRQIASGSISYVPINITESAGLQWLKQARQLWRNVDYNWQRWVVNYNQQNQSNFLASLGINSIKTMVYWLVGCIALITCVMAGFILYKKPRQKNKAIRIYLRFCRKLEKQGLTRKRTEGAQDFARRIIRNYPECEAKVMRITRLFIRINYRQQASEADLKQFNRLVNEFKLD